MAYGVTRKPSMHELYMAYVQANEDWIVLGLAAVNLWGAGIDGVRVPLQMVVAQAIQEAYSRGLQGLPPRDIPYKPPVMKRAPPAPVEALTPVIMRRSKPAPPPPPIMRRSR